MDPGDLTNLLKQLVERWENELVEFKNVGDNYSTSEIGKYYSAIANEANLHGLERGWFVFGVDNRSRRIVGSEYRTDPQRLQNLKHQISQGTEPSVTVREIHELQHPDGRVLLLEIPAAPRGMPIAWNGHYFARAGESLTALGLDKLDEIRHQSAEEDWTAQVVADASIEDLSDEAIQHARKAFTQKHANTVDEEVVRNWSNQVFLDRARVTINGQITRTALLLLGKSTSSHYLSPNPAQLTWRLETDEQAYEHIGPPFLLGTTVLFRKIRNVQIRILPDDALLPMEVSKYDQKVVLEALHNCIAHQDYRANGRVVVTEYADRLVFENAGPFFEGEPADYFERNKTPLRYRNTFLAHAMTELNMIDTMGFGISRMFRGQAKRYFPLPDYDLSPGQVRATIYGRVLDPAYSRMLIQKTDLPLEDILALDRIQKHQPVDAQKVRHLRKAGLIEGRKPNLHVSATVARASATKAEYIRTRAQDDAFYKKLITDYIEKFGSASRKEVDELLLGKLSEALNTDQKRDKISNLLSSLRRAGTIENKGSRKASEWVLSENVQEKTGGDAE